MFAGEFPPPPFGMMMPPGGGPMPGKYQRMPMYGAPRPPFMPGEIIAFVYFCTNFDTHSAIGNPGDEDPDSRKRDRDG